MAGSSVRKTSSPHSTRRPGMVRVHHTWHGEMPHRSHFEDFMREIGVDAQATHLCCVPRQVTKSYVRVRSKSEPALVADADELISASHTTMDRGRSTNTHNPRRQSFPTAAPKRLLSPPPAVTRPALPSRTISAFSLRGSEPSSPAPAGALKTPPLTSLYTQNHGATYISATVSADQALRNSMRVTVVGELPHGSSPQAPHAGTRDHWTPLAHRPALVSSPSSSTSPPAPTPKRSVSRVPSFASLETVSSSEGPETPRGHISPLLEPSQPSPLTHLEKTSRIRVPGQCVACQRTGFNFPSCPSCGDMWCSRECRVRATRGSTHLCLATGRRNAPASSKALAPPAIAVAPPAGFE